MQKKSVNLFIISYKQDLLKLPEFIKKKSVEFRLDISSLNFTQEGDFNRIYLHKNKIEKVHFLKQLPENGDYFLINMLILVPN